MSKNTEQWIKENSDELDAAKKLLSRAGYVVRKWTPDMGRAAKACEDAGFNGDCLGCACSVCLMH